MRRLGVLAAILLALPAGSSAATSSTRAGVFTGYGFDACSAPSTATLNAWTQSPYRALGIYIGGVNRACAQKNLTASWVAATTAAGWSLLPLYVGLQAPCVSSTRVQRISTNLTTAANQGRAAADDAADQAGLLALPSGSPVYLDMEGYAISQPACTKVVQTFVTAWVNEVRARGLVAGVYGSAASTIRDVALLGSALPDAAWIANWNGVEAVFGDPHVSDSLWTNHQRVHQYKGGHKETWGGVTINIDNDFVDGPVVGSAVPPPPPPPPPAGSVASGDGRAIASWPSGAFAVPVVVTLTTTAQPPAPNGYAVQLTVTDSETNEPVPLFAAPVTVHLLGAAGLTASVSTDGVTWRPAAPADVTTNADGSVDIRTTAPGYFGLLPDTTPPTRPTVLTGRFVKRALQLAWPPAKDNSGPVRSYDVLIDGAPLTSVSGTSTRATVRTFHPSVQTVFRVRAIDTADNAGAPSPPLVVVPTRRPTSLPRPIPRWAWGLYDFQHGRGARPAAAPRKVPAWYWRWAAWRATPFHVRR